MTLRVVLHFGADRDFGADRGCSPLVQVSQLLMAEPGPGWQAAGPVRAEAGPLARIVMGFLRRTTVDSLRVTAGGDYLEVTAGRRWVVGTRATRQRHRRR